MVKNMEVKNTYKKVGDFLKGKNDLDVNINNKKLIVTESGNKNMTLNNFVFIKNNKEENDKDTSTCVNEESINNVNLHKNQTRRKIEKISDKNNNKKDDSIDIEENTINNIIDNDDEITNPFIKAQLEDIDIEEDNNPTKIKSKNKNIKDNKKNSEKIPFKTILDFFN